MTSRKPAPPAQDGLLDLLDGQARPEPAVARPDPLWGALDVKWSKPPAGRNLCQDCVDLIHGRPGGTHPLVATARRKGPNGDRLLCPAHAQMHRDEDDRVQRRYASEIAARKAAQKAAIAGSRRRREHA